MKLSVLLSTIAYVTAASAALGWSSSNGDQIRLSEDLQVPGSNPLLFCEDPTDNILTIDNVDLDPNPPEAGKKLSIVASGTLHKDIEPGAKVHLQVKFGLITLINQEADLCDQVKNVELECPLKAGDLTLTKEVDLPAQIPPGKYSVLADVYTKDKEKITCLTADVWFHR
ncbi:uncharacterized protein PV09_03284 [Verruconis gallopava]|uniref:Phosphatidylglycerol/phosphatidylinositol transfer protein n=1 Tax=Verruconis gallopava TaxID=253628 RepID=A0A0D1YZI7_9PEZI|nr:uncharacterized protein PV09_03284 [Verruconis gallopava]KIW06117.1 hypothetical protein PV09_03284 [Verruconis gallopava]